MHKIRDFKLALRADGVSYLRSCCNRTCEGVLDNISSQPLLTSIPWGSFGSIGEVSEHIAPPFTLVSVGAQLQDYRG